MRRSFSRRAQPRRWALAAARCTARLAWCACALRGGQGAWRAARGASSGLGPPFEGSLARWGVVARWGCSSRACRSLVLDLACWCLQNSDPELSPIYCGSWQCGRVAQSFLARQQAPGLAALAPGLAAPAAAPGLAAPAPGLAARCPARVLLRCWRSRAGWRTAPATTASRGRSRRRRLSVLLLRLVALTTPHSLSLSPRPSPPPRTFRAPAAVVSRPARRLRSSTSDVQHRAGDKARAECSWWGVGLVRLPPPVQ